MEKQNSYKIIIVDDDVTNIMVTELIVRKTIGSFEIKSFALPQLALKYIKTEYTNVDKKIPTILLLDLYRFAMNSFEFLDNFSNLSTNIKEQFKIVALTCDIDKKEKEKAMRYPYVIDYRIKPITAEVLRQLINENSF